MEVHLDVCRSIAICGPPVFAHPQYLSTCWNFALFDLVQILAVAAPHGAKESPTRPASLRQFLSIEHMNVSRSLLSASSARLRRTSRWHKRITGYLSHLLAFQRPPSPRRLGCSSSRACRLASEMLQRRYGASPTEFIKV